MTLKDSQIIRCYCRTLVTTVLKSHIMDSKHVCFKQTVRTPQRFTAVRFAKERMTRVRISILITDWQISHPSYSEAITGRVSG